MEFILLVIVPVLVVMTGYFFFYVNLTQALSYRRAKKIIEHHITEGNFRASDTIYFGWRHGRFQKYLILVLRKGSILVDFSQVGNKDLTTISELMHDEIEKVEITKNHFKIVTNNGLHVPQAVGALRFINSPASAKDDKELEEYFRNHHISIDTTAYWSGWRKQLLVWSLIIVGAFLIMSLIYAGIVIRDLD